MTGALLKIDIRGRDGATLARAMERGPEDLSRPQRSRAFPICSRSPGPGSPSVLTNMLPTIEQHVDWIADALACMRERKLATIEASAQAQERWVAHVGELASQTLRYTCGSWYLGANVPGKPRVFMPYIGGFPRYVQQCRDVAANGYAGFTLR